MRLLFSFILFFSAFSHCETVRLAWIAPTERVNGEKLDKSEIAYYLLIVNDGSQETIFSNYVFIDLPAGQNEYAVSVCDINGLCSTNKSKKFTVKALPKSPKYPSASIAK